MSVKDATGQARRPQLPRRTPAVAPPSGAEVGVEERRAPRKETKAHGFVRVRGYRMNLPCRILDMSATGARLQFNDANAHHLPDRIIVAFSDHTEIDAEIRWRKERECGVRFVSQFRQLQARPDPA
ncbi:MAG: PilZ domain-containing protein [Hyphomicrobiaceae bacterium]